MPHSPVPRVKLLIRTHNSTILTLREVRARIRALRKGTASAVPKTLQIQAASAAEAMNCEFPRSRGRLTRINTRKQPPACTLEDTAAPHQNGGRKGVGAMSKKHLGSSIDNFLKEEGIFEETQAQAIKEVVAWQLAEAMRKKKISKNRMATLLKTSRTQVDRLLDPKNDITLRSLQRAAAMVGRRVIIQLV
jgi:antitoxin HicB